jgi:DNA polymerase-3 subunit gamma/tau
MSEVLYRKYRPAAFADVTGQEHVKTTLQNQIASGSVAHAYLFTGPRGVGKTTVARLLAKAVNCRPSLPEGGRRGEEVRPCNECEACQEISRGAALDVVEIDAASQTGVENVRENIIEAVRFAPNRLKFKVYIIDEVHMLSTSSFNALLKTLEEPPAHALFILATTEIHKVPATIVSRCQRFDFRRLDVRTIEQRLKKIAEQENVKVDENVFAEIARQADGGLRDAESLLGQVLALGGKKITMEVASLVLPATNRVMVEAFVSALTCQDTAAAIRTINEAVEQGVDLPHFTEDVVSALRDKMMRTACSELIPLIESLLEACRQMKIAKIIQLPLEIAVIKACSIQDHPKVQAKEDNLVIASEVKQSPVTPEPIAPVATALGDIPVLDLEDVKRRWPEVFEQIKSCNATLPMALQTGELSAVDGDAIELTFGYAVYAEAVNQDKNRRLLETVFTRVLGRPIRIKAKHAKKEAEQVVDQLLDAFGGSVIS